MDAESTAAARSDGGRLGAGEDSVADPATLRHTFGTRWLQAGGDIYKLSKILGHSSVAVTEAHYAHLLKEDLVAASQQVGFPSLQEARAEMSCECRVVVAAQHDGQESPRPVHKRLAPLVFIKRHISRFFEYTWGMRKTLDRYLDERLGRGRGYLTKAEAMKTLGLSSTAFAAAAARRPGSVGSRLRSRVSTSS